MNKKKTYLIVGDSFVKGTGASELQNGWAYLLKERYDQSKFIISGVGGDNIEAVNSRLNDLLKEKYDIVILGVGINDSRYRPSLGGFEVSLDNFKDGLSNFAQRVRSQNRSVKIYIVELTYVNESLTSPYKPDKYYSNENIKKFNQAIIETAKNLGVKVIKAPSLNNRPNLLSDGLHPSDLGHFELYKSIIEGLD